jgi:hypothetical protein
MSDSVVVQPMFPPIPQMPIFRFDIPEDFQETASKNFKRMQRGIKESKATIAAATEAVKNDFKVHDYINIIGVKQPDPAIKETYEKIRKCSEFDSTQMKKTTDQLSGLSNTHIGAAGMEMDTQSLSLTLIKKRTFSNYGQKPQILTLKNGKKFLSQIDSLVQSGIKDEQEGTLL